MILHTHTLSDKKDYHLEIFQSNGVWYSGMITRDENYIDIIHHFAFFPSEKDTLNRGQGRDVYDTSFDILERYVNLYNVHIKFDVDKYNDESNNDVIRKHLIYHKKLSDIQRKLYNTIFWYDDGLWHIIRRK